MAMQAKECFLKNSQKQAVAYESDKFRATKVWKQLVAELRERIADKADLTGATSSFAGWRGPKLFSGMEAIETLMAILTEKRESLGLKEVTEEKATKFCEILLRDNVVAPAPDNRNGKHFVASKTAFYYFNDVSNSSLPGMDNASDAEKENALRFVTPKSCRSLTPYSLKSTSSMDGVSELDEKIIRDFALSRLLILVDIPVLEGILHMRTEDESGSMLKTLENLFSGMKLGFNKAARSPDTSEMEMSLIETSDPWILAASQCLKVCNATPDASASSSQETLYRAVVNAYKTVTSKRGTLIPQQYDDVVAQISLLIASGSPDDAAKALEAWQCLSLLLPKETRSQLEALLHFLSTAYQTEAQRYGKVSNVYTMVVDFSKFVLPKGSHDDAGLMRFLLTYAHDILVCPEGFKERAYYYCRLLQSQVDPKPEMTFCKRITSEEYKRQSLTETERALYDALTKVIDDEQMTVKEKLAWFEKFRMEYPKIYEARFPSLK